MQAGPTPTHPTAEAIEAQQKAPSPTGWPPGPSIKTITHTSTTPPLVEGTGRAQSAAALGPPDLLSGTDSDVMLANADHAQLQLGSAGSDHERTTWMPLSGSSWGYSMEMEMEEEECDDDPPVHVTPASAAARSHETAPIISSSAQVSSPRTASGQNHLTSQADPMLSAGAEAAVSSQASGMNDLMHAGRTGMAGDESMERRTLFMRDHRRSRRK